LATGIHRHCFGNDTDYGMDEELAAFGLERFAEAMGLAENETVRRRVEKASLCAYRAAIDPVLRDPRPLDADAIGHYEPLVRRFFQLCRKYGVMKIRECSVREWRPVAAEIRQIEGITAELESKTGLRVRDK
jgi:hypothetical protein